MYKVKYERFDHPNICCIHLLLCCWHLGLHSNLFVKKVSFWSLFEEKQRSGEGDEKEVSYH
jgi:hypothetical protein